MIAKAMERFLALAGTKTFEIGGVTYSNEKLKKVVEEPIADPISVDTLSGVIDYIEKVMHAEARYEGYFIHVRDYNSVEIVGLLNVDKKRETLLRASAYNFNVPVNCWQENEKMIIVLQTMFAPTEDLKKVMKFVGTVTQGTIKDYSDDGVTQKATIRSGVSSKSDAVVPGPVRLRPYRTFIEVEQPESAFVFRMREGKNMPESALFSADGGIWKVQAVTTIKRFLEEKLAERGINIPVIL